MKKAPRKDRKHGTANPIGSTAGLREGDGIDPRVDLRLDEDSHGRTSSAHQQRRFYAQVHTAVESALQTAVTPILNELSVREVVKERGALLVIIEPQTVDRKLDIIAAAKAVEQASSMIRREVASAITRKEAPVLRFAVLPAGAAPIDQGS